MIKNHRGKAMAIALLFIAICGLILLGGALQPAGERMDPLKVTLFKVGKADAIVLQTQDKTMVIDAGEEEDGEELIAYLEHQGIQRVDVLIITHYDRDHVGGADTVVEAMEIGRVLLPAYAGASTEYADFMAALKQKNLIPEELTQPVEFTLGEASVLVEPPLSYETTGGVAEIDNNFSLITTVIHGKNRLLFTGDAEKQRLREWVPGETAQDCDFLKVPHHGVYTTALKDLLEAVTPEYAVICSSNKHPGDVQTLELLKQRNVQILETKDGNVTLISDGNGLEIHQALEH